jgi:hypothetical protein
LGRWLVVIALVLSTGGHWALLQVCAWAGMVVSYSQTDSLADALVKTFDGDHPCKLCKVVKEGRKAEQEKPAALKVEQKLDLFFAAQTITIDAPRLLRDDTQFSPDGSSRHDPPLLRPPISA